jgi:TRAP transporter TAXI family solute receptor
VLLRRSMTFSHIIYAAAFPLLAAVLALVAVVILVLRFAETPETLKVAVGPEGGADARLVFALAKRLEHDHAALRLTVRSVESPAEAAMALQDGAADLAVIRTDAAIPANAATVAVLHNDVAVLAAPHGSSISKPAELAGRRIGVFPASAANAALLDAVLAEYKIEAHGVETVLLPADELARTGAEKRFDALFVVGPLHGTSVENAIEALMPGKRDAVLIPIDAAEGMAARGPAYRKVDLPNGFFPGSPPLPDDAFATIGFAVSLEARQTLPDATVTNLTKRLFDARRQLAAEAPGAASIEKPDGDRGSLATVHPGAAAYYGDSEKSFMDLYGDWIYIGAMVLSGLGSGAAAMVGMTRARARKSALALIDQLIDLKQMAHHTMSLPRLVELDRQIEDLSTSGLRFARDHDFDEAGLSALRLAIDEARRAINDQVNELEEKSPLIVNAASVRSLPHLAAQPHTPGAAQS